MRILLAEDDEDKRHKVAEYLRLRFDGAELIEVKSLQTGFDALEAMSFDLVVLDMSMPTFEISTEEPGGRPQGFGGEELLTFMRRERITTPAVVLTQYSSFGVGTESTPLYELERRLVASHANYLGAVHYDSTSEDWKVNLSRLLARVNRNEEPQ